MQFARFFHGHDAPMSIQPERCHTWMRVRRVANPSEKDDAMKRISLAAVLACTLAGLAGLSANAATPSTMTEQQYLTAAARAIDSGKVGEALAVLDQARAAIPQSGGYSTGQQVQSHQSLVGAAIDALRKNDTDRARNFVSLAMNAPLTNEPPQEGLQPPPGD